MNKLCGICGVYGFEGLTKEDHEAFQEVLLRCQSRGTDAFGYYSWPNKELFKTKGSVSEHLNKDPKMYKKWDKANVILGHTRAVTTGSADKNHNNHPFETKDFVLAHNGCIWNHKEFNYKGNIETDSYVIIKNIQKEYDKKKTVSEAIKNTCVKLQGNFACWLIHKTTGHVYLFRHNNPIDIRYNDNKKIVMFASELPFMSPLFDRENILGFFRQFSYQVIKEDVIYELSKETGLKELDTFTTKPYGGYQGNVNFSNHTSATKDYYNVKKTINDISTSIGIPNGQIAERIWKQTGISYVLFQNALDNLGIQTYIRNGRVYLDFSTEDVYEIYKDVFETNGFTISPTSHVLTLSKISDIEKIEEIIEYAGEDLEEITLSQQGLRQGEIQQNLKGD